MEMGANDDEQDHYRRVERPESPTLTARDSLSRSRSVSPEVAFADAAGGGKRPPRLSTGSIGSKLKNALSGRGRRGTNDALPSYEASPRGSFESEEVEREEEERRRAEKRREVEEILRRAQQGGR